ncbi:MAG: hypothetical protein J5I94_15950 [Phaeodactylibacter sp.]|nr:hypothetical protein [Phaeodactylibacter sp.]
MQPSIITSEIPGLKHFTVRGEILLNTKPRITIHQLLAGGRTAEALERLQEHILDHAPRWRQSILLLRASWARLEQEIRQDLASGEEAERRLHLFHSDLATANKIVRREKNII